MKTTEDLTTINPVRATWLMDSKTAKKKRCSRRQPVDVYRHERMMYVLGRVFVITRGDAGHLTAWVALRDLEGMAV